MRATEIFLDARGYLLLCSNVSPLRRLIMLCCTGGKKTTRNNNNKKTGKQGKGVRSNSLLSAKIFKNFHFSSDVKSRPNSSFAPHRDQAAVIHSRQHLLYCYSGKELIYVA